ncbi:aromatic ring-hydroxylating oxygenase subunit alpha [Stakelama tenebrarum]|uniref:Aromatic ring-hydroxylating dioxygenase subunit alpha n=1 Tax=Stakelama tenebrarum TaxID=2711215 RepID=A0A6G6Y800_9SPHN|nr:aromatic ring-hydroxylating dioxygenase subunit alpha [Sphingosinithalassobacter tenebrarum]QIG81039.1 aromatic ring-hydroxylating dioxygenase subunit alpha [Sphingosinithalassobacter tenebrarum]
MNAPVQPFEPVAEDSLAWLGTDPVPAAPYYDPAWFEDEREAVFRRSWLQIGHVCELPEPGSFIRREVEILRASLLIVRSKDGAIRAFHNVCTHRGTQLVEEAQGKRSTFSCPYHRWTFGNDGRLLSAPDFERFHVTKEDCALPQVAVDTCGGLIFVNFDPAGPQPLRDYLGSMAERLEALPSAQATTFSEYVYETDANWKLTYDNFQENYHLRFIHPRSGAATIGEDNPFGYPLRYGFEGPHRTQTIWANPAPKIAPVQGMAFGRAMACVAADGFEASATGRDYLALFPNFFVLGSPTQPFSHTVWPIAAGKSRGVVRIYWKGEDDSASRRFVREYMMATARDIHAEDRAVIAAGHRGLASGALKHIHFQSQEVLCRHLYRSVAERVQKWREAHRI